MNTNEFEYNKPLVNFQLFKYKNDENQTNINEDNVDDHGVNKLYELYKDKS